LAALLGPQKLTIRFVSVKEKVKRTAPRPYPGKAAALFSTYPSTVAFAGALAAWALAEERRKSTNDMGQSLFA